MKLSDLIAAIGESHEIHSHMNHEGDTEIGKIMDHTNQITIDFVSINKVITKIKVYNYQTYQNFYSEGGNMLPELILIYPKLRLEKCRQTRLGKEIL